MTKPADGGQGKEFDMIDIDFKEPLFASMPGGLYLIKTADSNTAYIVNPKSLKHSFGVPRIYVEPDINKGRRTAEESVMGHWKPMLAVSSDRFVDAMRYSYMGEVGVPQVPLRWWQKLWRWFKRAAMMSPRYHEAMSAKIEDYL